MKFISRDERRQQFREAANEIEPILRRVHGDVRAMLVSRLAEFGTLFLDSGDEEYLDYWRRSDAIDEARVKKAQAAKRAARKQRYAEIRASFDSTEDDPDASSATDERTADDDYAESLDVLLQGEISRTRESATVA